MPGIPGRQMIRHIKVSFSLCVPSFIRSDETHEALKFDSITHTGLYYAI